MSKALKNELCKTPKHINIPYYEPLFMHWRDRAKHLTNLSHCSTNRWMNIFGAFYCFSNSQQNTYNIFFLRPRNSNRMYLTILIWEVLLWKILGSSCSIYYSFHSFVWLRKRLEWGIRKIFPIKKHEFIAM